MEILKSKIVSSGKYIAACCPFCENIGKTPDTKFHLYILPNKWFFCYRCNKRGSYSSLVQNFKFNVSISNIRENFVIEKPELNEFDNYIKANTSDFNIEGNDFAYYTRGVYNYLISRNLTDDLISRFNVKAGRNSMYGRVVFIDNVNSYYVGRSFLPNVKPKTLNPESKFVKPLMYFNTGLYKTLFLVEGIFDMVPFLKKGLDAVAILGKDVSNYQLLQLGQSRIGNIVVALDLDAADGAVKLANKIANIYPEMNIGVLKYESRDCKDPGEFDVKLFDNSSIFWHRLFDGEIINEPVFT